MPTDPGDDLRALHAAGLSWTRLGTALGVSGRAVHGWSAGLPMPARHRPAVRELAATPPGELDAALARVAARRRATAGPEINGTPPPEALLGALHGRSDIPRAEVPAHHPEESHAD